ncbi:hypothetical protein BH18ACT17_BH18ACT17_13290 [soil metagenome]
MRSASIRETAALSLPVIAGAGLYKGADLAQTGPRGYESQFFWGVFSSGMSGFMVIWGLLRYLKRHDFKVFMLYRLAAAALVFGLIAAGVREATI